MINIIVQIPSSTLYFIGCTNTTNVPYKHYAVRPINALSYSTNSFTNLPLHGAGYLTYQNHRYAALHKSPGYMTYPKAPLHSASQIHLTIQSHDPILCSLATVCQTILRSLAIFTDHVTPFQTCYKRVC
jgi:hypothetical protein